MTSGAEVREAIGAVIGAAAATAPDDMPDPEVMDQAAAAFGMLASPTRLQIVWILAAGECDVTGLAEQVGGTLPAVSQHLAKLRLAGLVRSRREGRRQVYLVDDPYLAAVVRLMVSQLSAQDSQDESGDQGLSAVGGPRTPGGLARGRIV
jgi:DNA-binding transcriptional ArsR family regulator